MKTTLFTNGYLSDDNWIAFFKSIYLDSIKISVDSIYDCSHSNIRKGNTLRTILNNIDKLINNKIKVEITTIAMKENLSEINDILSYFKEKKSAVTHYIDSYIPNSLEIDTDLNIITPEEYSLILCKRCKDNNLKKLSLKEHYCGFAYNYIFISSEGIVKLFPTMHMSLILVILIMILYSFVGIWLLINFIACHVSIRMNVNIISIVPEDVDTELMYFQEKL